MSETKSFIVNKEAFQKEFLSSITKFKASCEFLPIHCVDGKLVVFCNHRVKDGKGSVCLYIEFEPESMTLEDGDVFYVKDPTKLEKTITLVDSERLSFVVSPSHIRATGDNEKFSFRLYDPLLASRDNTFWKPKKFVAVRSKFNDGVEIDKVTLDKIQKSCNYIVDDVASIEYDTDMDKNYIIVGNTNNDSFKMEIPFYDGFSSFSKFSKHLFSVVGKNKVSLAETDDKKIVNLREVSEHTTKFCFVTKFAD